MIATSAELAICDGNRKKNFGVTKDMVGGQGRDPQHRPGPAWPWSIRPGM